jgi:phosphoribosylaminoimidazole-succinocarboxamide synthase
MKPLLKSDLKLPGLKKKYRGKVRDVYFLEDDLLVMLVSDRISAFDKVFSRGIPYKGQILNRIAKKFLDESAAVVPNWKIADPDPVVMVGRYCKPFPVEMIIRAYLTGSAWRAYKSGRQSVSGIALPDGMKEFQAFDKPIITPSTKEELGHDEEISKEEIIKQGIVSSEDYATMEAYTYKLFELGSKTAENRGLIMADTKYEFGKKDGKIYLIDEIHTPDSTRYFYADNYKKRFAEGLKPKQLSKEFLREYLLSLGFSGENRQKVPELSEAFAKEVSERYIELFEILTGEKFKPADGKNPKERIQKAMDGFFRSSN